MAIKNTVLGVSPTSIYSSSKTSAVSTIYLCNKSQGMLTFSIYAVPAGQVANIDNIIYYDVQLSPTDTYVIDTERLILDNNDSLVALASQDNAIVVTVSYVGV